MLADAMKSKVDALRCRDDNPGAIVAGPDRGERTAKQWLYPSEFLAFVSCAEAPLHWRRIVALMTYLHVRPGELRELRVEDVDLAHGVIHVHRTVDQETGNEKGTKTGHARRFSVEPAVMPLLRLLCEGRPASDHVIRLPCDRDLARDFRRWLARAGVKRNELFEATPTRKAITVYDLRATGITWRIVRGDDHVKVQRAAGHKTFSTTEGYIREAEGLTAGFGDVFPPLPSSLLVKEPASIVSAIVPGLRKARFLRGKLAERAGFEPAVGF